MDWLSGSTHPKKNMPTVVDLNNVPSDPPCHGIIHESKTKLRAVLWEEVRGFLLKFQPVWFLEGGSFKERSYRREVCCSKQYDNSIAKILKHECKAKGNARSTCAKRKFAFNTRNWSCEKRCLSAKAEIWWNGVSK